MERIHHTKQKCVFLNIWNFETFHFSENRKCFDFWGVFVKEVVIFNIGFGFSGLNSIW